jgi:thioredoxin-like negative regulator of GroEL
VHVAIQPPQYLSDYQQGVKLASTGQLDGAIDHLTAAAEANPSYVPARFQLARARLARGDIDAAINNFDNLARHDSDVHSMAYLGYCFNLKRLPVAAIPWYERAMHNGAVSATIYNNLGASLLDGSSNLGNAERVWRADECLKKAIQLDSKSATIQLNVVRVAVAKSKIEPSQDPFDAWTHARDILASAPEDERIRVHVATWYDTVVMYEAARAKDGRTNNTSLSAAEKSARNTFAALLKNMESSEERIDHANAARSWQSEKSNNVSVARYFLEPNSLESEQSQRP